MKYPLTVLIRDNFRRSLGEAERLIETGKVKVNGKTTRDTEHLVDSDLKYTVEITVGSRTYSKLVLLHREEAA